MTADREHDVHADVAGYVVDELTTDERVAFEAHLRDCDRCRRELLELTDAAAELAALVDTGPPPQLRSSVLAGIRTVRPSPPWSEETPATPSPEPVDELSRRRGQQRNRRGRFAAALVAAAVVAAVALGAVVVNLGQQHQQQVASEAAAQRESELLAAPDTRILTQVRGGARYRFVVSRQLDEALLVPSGLPDPGAGKVYQLWTLQGRQATPDATMPADAESQWFTGPIGDSTTLAVTVEPEGGSAQPTPPILAQVTL